MLKITVHYAEGRHAFKLNEVFHSWEEAQAKVRRNTITTIGYDKVDLSVTEDGVTVRIRADLTPDECILKDHYEFFKKTYMRG